MSYNQQMTVEDLAQLIDESHVMKNDQTEYDKDSLFCSVCLKLFTSPMMLSCSHLLCKTCHTNLKIQKCPLCTENIEGVSQFSQFTNYVLKLYKFKCVNTKMGCNMVTTFDNLLTHHQTCTFRDTKCTSCRNDIGCGDISNHVVACSYCKTLTCVKMLETHMAKCNNINVPCPLCETPIQNISWQNHKLVCDRRLIQCPHFHFTGCNKLFTKDAKDDIESHANDYKYHYEKIILGLAQTNYKKLPLGLDDIYVGMNLDVLDTTKKWEPAMVIEKTNSYMKITYLRWGNKWDECISNGNMNRVDHYKTHAYGNISNTKTYKCVKNAELEYNVNNIYNLATHCVIPRVNHPDNVC